MSKVTRPEKWFILSCYSNPSLPLATRKTCTSRSKCTIVFMKVKKLGIKIQGIARGLAQQNKGTPCCLWQRTLCEEEAAWHIFFCHNNLGWVFLRIRSKEKEREWEKAGEDVNQKCWVSLMKNGLEKKKMQGTLVQCRQEWEEPVCAGLCGREQARDSCLSGGVVLYSPPFSLTSPWWAVSQRDVVILQASWKTSEPAVVTFLFFVPCVIVSSSFECLSHHCGACCFQIQQTY